ncbi:hypothetical protein [Paenibacillus pasadenensis]|uniref:hypothetical protein n=1 Tax=Paenibacillus pasadenensis TaxID=217090 RepID=UPI002041F7A3|nr:hypothetical protein [Paenibacillus pasadenensis]
MVNTYRLLLLIQVSSFMNRLVYYIRRLPGIGRLVPESFYARNGLKRAMSVVVFILGVLWAVANKFIYLILMIYGPLLLMAGRFPPEDRLLLFLNLLLPLSFLTAFIWNARVMEPKRDKYVAVRLMRIRPDQYMKATLSYRYLLFFVSFFIALAVMMPLLGGSLLDAFMLALCVTMWRVIGEWAHLKLFQLTGIVLIKNQAVVWLSIFAGAAAAYGPALLGKAPGYGQILLMEPVVICVAVLGAASAYALLRYKDYPAAVEAATKRDDPLLNLGKMMSDAKRADVETKESDFDGGLDHAGGGKASRKQGHAFLNELFFSRHRRLIRKPLVTRLAAIGSIGVLACVLLKVVDLLPEGFSFASAAPYLPFALYSLTVGERLCRAMFYNCDLPLMRYSFYREASPKHYRIRLLRLSGMNLLSGAAVAAALTLAAIAGGEPLPGAELLLVWALILTLSLLFSVHHLSMYYLFQPYTPEMDSKNPLFFISNMVLSGACGATFVLRPELPQLAAGAAVLLVVYLAAAMVLIQRIGPRTFRVK